MAAGTTLTLGSSNTTALSNTGLISGTDDTVNIYSFGSFSNTGTFNITNSAVHLYGSYTTAQLALFDNRNDTITIDGTLTNTGATLNVGPGSALGTVVLASGGTIVGGTIVDQGSGVSFQGGTLSGVTYDGTLDLSPNNSTVYIANRLTANNWQALGPEPSISPVQRQHLFRRQPDLQQRDHQSRQHVGLLRYDLQLRHQQYRLGADAGPERDRQSRSTRPQLRQLTSAGYNHTGDGIVNQGTINAEAVNGTFYIEPYNFTNQGTINVSQRR